MAARLARWLLALLVAGAAAPALAQPASPWTCDRSRTGAPVLSFRGGVDPGEFNRFKAAWQGCFPSGYGGNHTIELHSGGGVVDEALAIANFLVDTFRNRPPLLQTRIPSGARCVSACTFLYVAGQRRTVEPGGSLEPHGFSRYLGARIDRVVREIDGVATEKRLGICKAFEVVDEMAWIRRLEAAGKGLKRVWADRRLAWVGEFLDMPVRTCPDLERKLVTYAKLPPDRAELIWWLDSVMAITLPEVERAAALRAFRTQFAIQAGQLNADAVPQLDRPVRHLRWALDASLEGINAYLDRSGRGPRLKDIDAASEDLRNVQQDAIGAATNSATGGLGTYLGRRRNDIDLPAFVKLMFSTSILYTRPLTREELCDHNLVNIGCD